MVHFACFLYRRACIAIAICFILSSFAIASKAVYTLAVNGTPRKVFQYTEPFQIVPKVHRLTGQVCGETPGQTHGDHVLTKELENFGYKIRSTVLFFFSSWYADKHNDVIPTRKNIHSYPYNCQELWLFKEINSKFYLEIKKGKYKTVHMLSVGETPKTDSILALLYFYLRCIFHTLKWRPQCKAKTHILNLQCNVGEIEVRH